MAGKFITIEGIEGAGKSSLINGLKLFAEQKGHQVLCSREPGGTLLGKGIRKLLLENGDNPPCSLAEVLLFAADRAQHVEEVLKPALDQGQLVICDRYTHSTLAYQGYGRGIDLSLLSNINQLATSGLNPDLTLLLDLKPETGLDRARKRAEQGAAETEGGWSRFEQEKLHFHNKLRAGFLELAKDSSQNIKTINAEAGADEVLAEAKNIVEGILL